MKKVSFFTIIITLFFLNTYSQKIDVDSLLVVTNKLINNDKNYAKAIELGKIGVEKSPNYLDFYISLGRAYKYTNEIDSARYYFNHVISKSIKYREAHSYIIQLELDEQNIEAATIAVEKALQLYPDEKNFYLLKLRIINTENNFKKSADYLQFLITKYPDDKKLKEQLMNLKLKSNSDRIGLSHNITFFNRDGFGPWNFTSLQYIRQRPKFTLIGRVSYTDRQTNGNSSSSGKLFDIDSYIKTSKKSYSYINIGYSEDRIFPKLRVNYSYFRNLGNGYEGEIGVRYNKRTDSESFSSVLAFGKYIGNSWLNLKTSVDCNIRKPYPSCFKLPILYA